MSQILKYLLLEGNYAVYRSLGECTFDSAVQMIDEALAYCKANDIRGLLVDVTGVTGVPPPSISQRFQFATQWALTAGGRVFLSMVAPAELIDSDHIGVTMANNRGLRSEVFSSEPEARKWLQGVCDKVG